MDQAFFTHRKKIYLGILLIFLVALSALTIFNKESQIIIPQNSKIGDISINENQNDLESADLETGVNERGNQAISISVNDALDLEIGKTYLISFSLRINIPPKIEKRQKLIAKYNTVTKPATGWAIALRRINSSMRLELYIQDQSENGGWFSLAPLNIKHGEDVEFFVIIKPNSYASAYARNSAEVNKPKVTKLGIVTLTKLGEIKSQGNLQITSGQPKNDQFQGVVEKVKIFRIENMQNQAKLIETIATDSSVFLNKINAKCIISFSEHPDSCDVTTH